MTPQQFRLSRPKTLALLDRLEAAGEERVVVFFAPGRSSSEVTDLLSKSLPGVGIPDDVPNITAASATGAAILWGASRKLVIRPPVPLTGQEVTVGGDIGPLRALLERRFTIGMVLVRLGAFAVGVWDGEDLTASKTGTGLVHGRHRKGGQSQRRFERRREKQADVFLERVCGHVRALLAPHVTALDYFVYGGSRSAIAALQRDCPFLRQFHDRSLPPLLNIPPPRRSVLEAAIGGVLSCRITEWGEGGAGRIGAP